ncbi:MAG: metal-sensitive transcriptional regulator [Bradymonadia bacterium]
MSHPDHSPELHRLNRIAGQLEGVRRMIEENRYCPEILAQVRAVHSALKGLEAQILKRHINHCLRAAIHSDDESAIAEQVDAVVDLFRKQS